MTEPIKNGESRESGVAPKGISTPHLRSMLNAAIESGDDKQRQLVAELISARFTLAEQREALILHAIFDGHHKDSGPACMANEYTMAIDVIEKLWKSRRMWQDVNDSLADEVLDLGEQLRNLQENYDRVEQQRDDARRRAASADGEANDYCDKYCAEIDENKALRKRLTAAESTVGALWRSRREYQKRADEFKLLRSMWLERYREERDLLAESEQRLNRLAGSVVRKQGAISSLVRTLWESRRQLQFLLGAEKANSNSLAAMVLGAQAADEASDWKQMQAAIQAERDAHPLLFVGEQAPCLCTIGEPCCEEHRAEHEEAAEGFDREIGDGGTTPIGIPEPDPEIGDPARLVAGAALSGVTDDEELVIPQMFDLDAPFPDDPEGRTYRQKMNAELDSAFGARPHVILRRDGSLEDATEENLDALQTRFRARPGVTNAQLNDGFPRVPEQGFQPELPFGEEDGQ